MRYHVLACDYDETIAHGGRVDDATVTALEHLSRSGRRLVMVTGRRLDDLFGVFDHVDLFDMVVAENGGVLYDPGRRDRRPLAERPPAEFVERLRRHGVSPLAVGEVVVATREPHDRTVLDAIRELGLELQVIYNKGAVMVLPPGVNKASGLAAALRRLEFSPHSTVAVGDAENDHAMLHMCECAVAVAGALEAVKRTSDLVLERPDGEGVAELVDRLLATDLAEVPVSRHDLHFGTAGAAPTAIAPHGRGGAVAGPSGSGKSTAATALLERLGESGYQYCVIDPEGDYADFEGVTAFGDATRAPSIDEVLTALRDPDHNVAVNMLAVPLRDRPAFFAGLLPRLVGLRAELGHPAWLVVDEAHHLMPVELAQLPLRVPADVGGLMLVTVHPETLSPLVLRLVDTVVAVGDDPGQTLDAFAAATGHRPPALEPAPAEPDRQQESVVSDIAVWRVAETAAQRVKLAPGETHRTRHRRKYAAGTLAPDKSFYFTGPQGRLRLRARNLHSFVELAEGVDDDTWTHHLRRHDYSRWLRGSVRDGELADLVRRVEQDTGRAPSDSRREVARLIDERYTLPAEPTSYDPDRGRETGPSGRRRP
ncbi:HAD-IIB family hydrolase [Thermobifida halotolerans]|uniref:HAD-IIB family hydrolase n=1 Tax=Thermobifida halotolerans TaxID=483545 RepID=UPI00083806A6|nr:HAD-IIB family hydrolase [Thermobifida halotolerans]